MLTHLLNSSLSITARKIAHTVPKANSNQLLFTIHQDSFKSTKLRLGMPQRPKEDLHGVTETSSATSNNTFRGFEVAEKGESLRSPRLTLLGLRELQREQWRAYHEEKGAQNNITQQPSTEQANRGHFCESPQGSVDEFFQKALDSGLPQERGIALDALYEQYRVHGNSINRGIDDVETHFKVINRLLYRAVNFPNVLHLEDQTLEYFNKFEEAFPLIPEKTTESLSRKYFTIVANY